MTYNVFGGTLNPAQSKAREPIIFILKITGFGLLLLKLSLVFGWYTYLGHSVDSVKARKLTSIEDQCQTDCVRVGFNVWD